MKTAQFQLTNGDVLTITWNGGAWQTPATGEQTASKAQAMRREIREYLAASGEQLAEHEVCLPELGEWVE